ncbi:hypothetical protein HNR22_005257 [Micromonospora jinlongensis]|uniref:Uncharacterized protein n=1 Tax=Micromonospora jinlongensis TaxID=1287877 RepID=A0A7Y9X7B5_9ACTN|nr:hypothetical protein [Micromonospora jinlongensis]
MAVPPGRQVDPAMPRVPAVAISPGDVPDYEL